MSKVSATQYLLYFILGSMIIGSFFTGELIGSQVAYNTRIDCHQFSSEKASTLEKKSGEEPSKRKLTKEDYISQLAAEQTKIESSKLVSVQSSKEKSNLRSSYENEDKNLAKPLTYDQLLPKHFKSMVYVPRDKFLQMFDLGVNIPDSKGMEYASVFYTQSAQTYPSSQSVVSSTQNATQPCNTLLIAGYKPRVKRSCIAFFENYDNFHQQRWMREGQRVVNPKAKLTHVGRGMQGNQVNQFKAPSKRSISQHWSFLKTYVDSLSDVLERLKPIVDPIKRNNTIVVLVCNYGQSSLLINFICNARAKKLDLSCVLVFATDEQTFQMAKGLNVSTFYDEVNTGDLPTQAALAYGGKVFSKMMWGKVICTHLLSMLNVNYLFQDVDIIWNRHPLDYFLKHANPDVDVYFQDDGAYGVRFAPYAANSGFYYVKSNDKTRYLFTALVYTHDTIVDTGSHQQTLDQLLIEHNNLYGLYVKILNGLEFAGGKEFHRLKDTFMRGIIEGKVEKPWTFHMCWTLNKNHKTMFFRQMGMWFVNDVCLAENFTSVVKTTEYEQACCAKEAIVSCHFKDKASVIPCKDSPSLDKGKRSFWK